ncbi:carcinoembryonic antigen-related cell adhesion molecule 1-like [Polypterus senegalus]|uniref:carcinoembryonic antigen-related cell adhesion molecule 1-like n=1 Tax=Polypterus senegalus TaxID=55291 RepID=UPI001965018E|nr:carcinoembryonic antigen-related cell adhesion molecule 1-like [Polypterus senegalus]
MKPQIQMQQCGFCLDQGTVDQLFTLRGILERVWEYTQLVYMYFVDLEKGVLRYSLRNSVERVVRVQDPVSVPTIQSSVTNPVEFNDTVTFTCTASGSDVSYRWFNGSSEFSDTQRIHLSADNRTLTISGVLRSDDGPFYCYVYNHVSNGTSKPFNLDVKYGPDLPTNKPVYAAGSSVIFQCSAQSSPTAQYQWFLNGTSLNKRDQELEIRNIQVDQAGNYTCWAFNDVTLRYAAVHTMIDVRGSQGIGVCAGSVGYNARTNPRQDTNLL